MDEKEILVSPVEPDRIKMQAERLSITHKFVLRGGKSELVVGEDGKTETVLSDVEGYITAGVYPDGKLGEVFLTIGKEGSHWKAFECLMVAVSIGLQYGIPLDVFAQKFVHMIFEPSGMTSNPDIPIAKSMADYLFRWLKAKFPDGVNADLAKACAGGSD